MYYSEKWNKILEDIKKISIEKKFINVESSSIFKTIKIGINFNRSGFKRLLEDIKNIQFKTMQEVNSNL